MDHVFGTTGEEIESITSWRELMWFRKKALIFLECVGCGCLMRRARKNVEVDYSRYGNTTTTTTDVFGTTWPYIEHYCGRCVPPYDIKCFVGSKTRYFRTAPSQNIEVTEKGKDIGGKGD